MHAPATGKVVFGSLASLASAQTLYGVSFYTSADSSTPFAIVQSDAAQFTPVGTAAEGAVTTYVEEIVVNYEANVFGTTETEVLLSAGDPITNYLTFAESSGGFIASNFVPSSVQSAFSATITDARPVESCAFGADGQASCIVLIPLPAQESVSVSTETLSGTVVPLATLATSESANASAGGNTSGAERIVARR
uniref:Uncharacterized protein n=1 Tax=Mycena chlorophos TaxID=658473 RepID=A0ABQ0LEI4_MYCCL|nr:predicted protein [Mycena chlorophos]